MNFTGRPIPLPIDTSILRCLAHGKTTEAPCQKASTCAAHLTIEHDHEPQKAAAQKCSSEALSLYLPVGGFELEDE